MLREMYTKFDHFRTTNTVFVDDEALHTASTSLERDVSITSAAYNECFNLYEKVDRNLKTEREEYDNKARAFCKDVERYGGFLVKDDLIIKSHLSETQRAERLEQRLADNEWARDIMKIAYSTKVKLRAMCDELLSELPTIEDQYLILLVESSTLNQQSLSWTDKLNDQTFERVEWCSRMKDYANIWEHAFSRYDTINPVAYAKSFADPTECRALNLRDHEERLGHVTLALDAISILHAKNVAEIIAPWKTCYEEQRIAVIQEKTWRRFLTEFIAAHLVIFRANEERRQETDSSFHNACSVLKERMFRLYEINNELQPGVIFERNSACFSDMGFVKGNCVKPEPKGYYDEYVTRVELHLKKFRDANMSFEQHRHNFQLLDDGFNIYNNNPTGISACSATFTNQQDNADVLSNEILCANCLLHTYHGNFMNRKEKVVRVKFIFNSLKSDVIDVCVDLLIPALHDRIGQILSQTDLVKNIHSRLVSSREHGTGALRKWNDERHLESFQRKMYILGSDDGAVKVFREHRNPDLIKYGRLIRYHEEE